MRLRYEDIAPTVTEEAEDYRWPTDSTAALTVREMAFSVTTQRDFCKKNKRPPITNHIGTL